MRLPPWVWRLIHSKLLHRFLIISPFALMVSLVLFFSIWNVVGERAVSRVSDAVFEAGFAESFSAYCNSGIPADEDVFRHESMLDDENFEKLSLLMKASSLPGLAKREPRSIPDLAELTKVEDWFDPPPPGGESEAAELLLSHHSSEIAFLGKLGEAVSRPRCSWGSDGVDRGKPDLVACYMACARLRRVIEFAARIALFEMAAGEPALAAEKVGLILDAEGHLLGSSPSSISLLHARSGSATTRRIIWEGIVRQSWSDENLAQFDRLIAGMDPRTAVVEAQKGELAFARDEMLGSLEVPRVKYEQDLLTGWDESRDRVIRRLRGMVWDYGPRGRWDYANAKSAEAYWHEGVLDGGNPRIRFSLADFSRYRQISSEESGLLFILKGGSSVIAPNPMTQGYRWISDTIAISLGIETDLTLLRTGIAIERYRRKTGHCPEQLDDLIPEFFSDLPTDPWSEEPLNYRRQNDGSPLVWSIGADRIDEGGRPRNGRDRGDDVWITSPISGFTEADYHR